MFQTFLERLRQGRRTMAFPDGPAPEMPDRFRGRPVVDASKCPRGCRACLDACPAGAIAIPARGRVRVDLGKCLFCPDCAEACPQGAIRHDRDFRLAAGGREDLVLEGDGARRLAGALEEKRRKLFGRSLRLRQVSAGGCNACEADLNVLTTVGWDLSRFGIQLVASPRHADGLLVTGPVTENMKEALRKTWEAMPEPRLVIAVGACAISGGLFAGRPETRGGAGQELPVDLYIPGCPPHPLTILDGLLRLLGRLE